MSDMAQTIIPKSDQLNADDLFAGPRTIEIRDVKIDPSTDQPVKIYFKGDDGRPYLPCKSMRRVVVAIWAADASAYIGRSMTIYRDPNVTWGGMKAGGIRISHMSHLEKETIVVLTESKKTRKPFHVAPLAAPVAPHHASAPAKTSAEDWAAELIAKIEAATDKDALHDIAGHPKILKTRDRLKETGREDLDDEIAATLMRRFQALAVAEEVIAEVTTDS